jgi:hypothetical protein
MLLRLLAAHLGRITALSWGAVAALWFLDAGGHPLPPTLDRLVVVAASVALAVFGARIARRLWTGDGAGGRLLLMLVLVSVAFHFIGLEHEAGTRYFGDEGIYRQQAQEINDGKLLRNWFVYPHLLFYLDALALWIAALFQPLVSPLLSAVYGVAGEPARAVMVTRAVTAACGAATVVPVFLIARRIAGTTAAGLAGALAAISPLYIEVCHLNISDVPSAFFASLTLLQVSRLLEREGGRDYVLAGLWAGLAAGSKYPAGLVAVAIVAIWVRWRIRERRFGAGLIWSGLAAIAAFLASTPSLLAFPQAVYQGGGTDILFGYRQYARAGWTGVVKASNFLYYWSELRSSLGEPALFLGLTGLAAWSRAVWERLLWMLPFPILFLALVLSMRMAVHRNLLPVIPMLAVVLGIGAVGWLLWMTRWWSTARRPALAVLAMTVLALPFVRASVLVTKLSRPTTRDLAIAWMWENLPPGSHLIEEAYTPRIGPSYYFPSRRPRFAIRLTREELHDPLYDFLFLASGAYRRFLPPQNVDNPVAAQRYREIFASFDLVREFEQHWLRRGPVIRVYRIDPDPLVFQSRREFTAEEALLRRERMRSAGDDFLLYTQAREWSLFKAYLEAGHYRAELDADLRVDGSSIRVLTRDKEEIAVEAVDDHLACRIELPRSEKYFLYVYLPAGSRLRGMKIEKLDPPPSND